MFKLRGRKKTSNSAVAEKQSSDIFEFTDIDALFNLQCKFGDTRLEPGKATFAVVVDAVQTCGLPIAVKINSDGTQTAVLNVVSEDGGFLVVANTRIPNKPPLKPGDPVLWVPKVHNKELSTQLGDERSGWVGFIGAKVSMVVPTSTGQWKIVEKYASGFNDDIKDSLMNLSVATIGKRRRPRT
jgi:hypothetical protein